MSDHYNRFSKLFDQKGLESLRKVPTEVNFYTSIGTSKKC